MLFHMENLSFQNAVIGRFQNDAGRFWVKARPWAAFCYRLKGDAYFEVGGASLHSKEGELFFLPDSTPYQVDYTGGESIVFHLFGCNYPTCECISVQNSSFYHNAFEETLRRFDAAHRVHAVKAAFYRLMESLYQEHAEKEDSGFYRCTSYLERCFADPSLTLSHVARASYCSEAAMRRWFHRYYGMSPKEYLTKLRLDKAIALLTEGGCTVKRAAQECGFDDEKYFSRLIRQKYGIPPSAFCRSIKYSTDM